MPRVHRIAESGESAFGGARVDSRENGESGRAGIRRAGHERMLLSAEGVCIPPSYAAEMMAYDPTAGERRTHYAGFFDPGFGYDAHGSRPGSRAALEVRARDVPFMVEDGQPICKLAFERMTERPEKLYGEDVGSNYQGQETMLSKHFVAQTAGAANPPGSEAIIA